MVSALSLQASFSLSPEEIRSLKNKIYLISSHANDPCSFSSALLCCALPPDISAPSQDPGPHRPPNRSDIYWGSFPTWGPFPSSNSLPLLPKGH